MFQERMISIEKSGGSTATEATVTVQKSTSSSNVDGFVLQRSKSGRELMGPEVVGPVYPVDVKHNFPPDVPKREDAPGKDDLKFPVLGVDGKHSFKDKAPAGLDEKHLTGPIFDVERSHS